METRNSSFEDHIKIVESSHSKTAGSRMTNKSGDSLLKKIAEELNLTAPAAPTAEGEVTPAASSVAGAAPAVVAATEAVSMPQVAIAGGNPEESAAGEIAAVTKPNEGLAISAGDGKVTDADNLNKTPESVAAAAIGGGGDEGSAAVPSPEVASSVPDQSLGSDKTSEAEKIGQLIAKSFQETLEKQAEENDYVEALGILKEAELLDNYDIKDEGMRKEASYRPGCLEKIANNKSLSRNDIIGAAVEFVEMQKEASYAEEKGREDARNLVNLYAEMQKNAGEEKSEQEKIASAVQDKEVVAAVQVLKNKGIL